MDTKSQTKTKPKSKANLVLKSSEKSEEEILTDKYVNQMDDIHKVAYLIAKDHLGSSFDLSKSIGFKNWNKNE
tara:strand:- start:18 stop:236 length:219 start_codon:yes stop_codon:yes gene_type:complete